MSLRDRPLCVLVIDDSDIARAKLIQILEAAGHRTIERETPIGASATIVHEQVDAVVLDINIPVMSGASFAKLLRRNPRMNEVKLILVSGDRRQLESVAEEVKCDAALEKVNVEQLLLPTIQRLFLRPSQVPQRLAIAVGGARFLLPFTGTLTIGRATVCDLVVGDEDASREHLRIEVENGIPKVRDLGSRNGTRLNGDPVIEPCELAVGDEIRIGETALRILESPPAASTRPTGALAGVE